MNPKVAEKAPDFHLKNQSGEDKRLSDYKGNYLLIYFYPKDDTPGCTKEACSIRDNLPEFQKLDFQVVGISADTLKSHQKFADKFKLNFDILADEEKKVVTSYGVWGKKKFMGKEYMGISRKSFLIDPNSKIVKIYDKIKPALHAQEVLEDLKKIKQAT